MTDEAGALAAAAFVDGIRSVRPFGGGHINETFLVETESGDYVLQRLNTTVFADLDAVMGNIRAVDSHLRGRLVPELVATPDGRSMVHASTGSWRMWRRVSGVEPVTDPTPTTAASSGELLGRFHALVVDLDPGALVETLRNFHDPARRLDALHRVIATDPHQRARSVRNEIDELLAAAPLAERARALTRAAPCRVAHLDAKLDNVLFRGGEAVCLVDLDTVMPGAWFWDLGDLARTAATPAREDDPEHSTIIPELYAAVLDGYRRTANPVLDPVEVEALDDAGAIVTFEQALRFLTDWLDGDVYYRTSRPDQNLDRTRAQLRLLASMPTTVRW
jgi:Ser/Thr protein kinase RdoA (MazF antagonist)